MQRLRPTPQEAEQLELAGDLRAIETAVEVGATDLSALGFWRLVARIKRDPVLVHALAEQAGRIDALAFRSRVRRRIPVWAGNVLLLALVAAGVAAIVLSGIWTGLWAGLALIAAAVAWSVGVHSPTHWLVGRFAGISFTAYFLGGPPPPRPGLKTDYATYLLADPGSRAVFHASGAIATKLAPFVALAISPATNAPGWAVAVVAVIAVGQIVTDVLFSRNSSDWKRFARERSVVRERR
ncbi:MAG TPA: hypothetical protein VK646_08260 [Actinomycetota bacterium]|nr:hypothetical protein [Actinomycetota bacterium]